MKLSGHQTTLFFTERQSGRGIPRSETLQERKYMILKEGPGAKSAGRKIFKLWVNGKAAAPRTLRKKTVVKTIET